MSTADGNPSLLQSQIHSPTHSTFAAMYYLLKNKLLQMLANLGRRPKGLTQSGRSLDSEPLGSTVAHLSAVESRSSLDATLASAPTTSTPGSRLESAILSADGGRPSLETHDDDDEADAHSDSSYNSTSTYEYKEFGHEPYDSFQHKVKVLITDLGGQNVELMPRMRGGGFNRVIPVRFDQALHQQPPMPVHAVLRIPRYIGGHAEITESTEDAESLHFYRKILAQANVNRLLCRHEIPAPHDLAFDATFSNVLKLPYTLQQFAQGDRLDKVWDGMSYAEKRQVVDQVIDIMLKMQDITFPLSGRLEWSGTHKEPLVSTLASKLHDVEQQYGVAAKLETMGFNTDQLPDAWKTSPQPTLYLLLKEQLSVHLARARKEDVEERRERPQQRINPEIAMFERLMQMLEEMKALGWFTTSDSSSNILHHVDFEPRNILLDFEDDANQNRVWKIGTILDWDDATSVPSVLTRRPPVWMWESEELCPDSASIPMFYDEDYDLLEPDRYAVGNGRLPAEAQAIKTYFETSFVRGMSVRDPTYTMEVYWDEAYRRGRWQRRLFRFTATGFSSSCDYKRYHSFVADWDKFRGNSK